METSKKGFLLRGLFQALLGIILTFVSDRANRVHSVLCFKKNTKKTLCTLFSLSETKI
jgi:hypothetical protein